MFTIEDWKKIIAIRNFFAIIYETYKIKPQIYRKIFFELISIFHSSEKSV